MERAELFDNDPVRVRVFERIAELGLDMADVSRKVEKNHAYIQQYLKRGIPRKLPENVRAMLAKVLEEDEQNLGGRHSSRGTADYNSTIDSRQIAEYYAHSGAGGGMILEDEDPVRVWQLPRDYLEWELGVPQNGPLAFVMVRGDSMEPTLRSGDRILIDRSDLNVSQPGIFVLWDGDGRVVKRVERVLGSVPQKLRLISDNPVHAAYEVTAELVTIIGRAVWAARQL